MGHSTKWFNTVFYPKFRIESAVLYEEKVLPRLAQAEVNLFTPWGPRYDWDKRGTKIKETDSEVRTLMRLQQMLELWQKHMTQHFQWIFLGADLYGTRINRLSAEAVADYFEQLGIWIGLLDLGQLHLWSEFDGQAERFRIKIANQFDQCFPLEIVTEASSVADKIGGGDYRQYLIERLAEAQLMEELFQPIKISCAAKHKDSVVDGPLPRLYLVPPKLQRPWFG